MEQDPSLIGWFEILIELAEPPCNNLLALAWRGTYVQDHKIKYVQI